MVKTRIKPSPNHNIGFKPSTMGLFVLVLPSLGDIVRICWDIVYIYIYTYIYINIYIYTYITLNIPTYNDMEGDIGDMLGYSGSSQNIMLPKLGITLP